MLQMRIINGGILFLRNLAAPRKCYLVSSTLTSSTIMPVSSAVICIPLIALFHTCGINLNVESRESSEPKTCEG